MDDSLDELGGGPAEILIAISVQASIDQIGELVLAIEFEIGPFFQNDGAALGAITKDMHFVRL